MFGRTHLKPYIYPPPFCNLPCSVNWYPTDTEELYKKNIKLPDHRQILFDNNWIDAEIIYQINSEGFRTPEFAPSKKRFMALGCSFTKGIGLPIDVVWPTLLSTDLGIEVDNLAEQGASNGLIFRIAQHWIPILKPQFVVVQQTLATRFEILDDRGHGTVSSSHYQTELMPPIWWANDFNSLIDADRNELAIRFICRELNIPVYFLPIDEFIKVWTKIDENLLTRGISQDRARDIMHPGKAAHRAVANILRDRINK